MYETASNLLDKIKTKESIKGTIFPKIPKKYLKKMDPIIKEKWVKALRTKKLKQDSEYLKTDDGYCCLGVLCEYGMKIVPHISNDDYASLFEDSSENFLSPKLLKRAGLTNTIQRLLSYFNDGYYSNCVKQKSYSFKEIANWIEEKL